MPCKYTKFILLFQIIFAASKPGQFIRLHFLSLATECSYDHVNVYDGMSFDSPKLGVFSGMNTQHSVTARSGYMLILLYSDTNYALEGFDAEYSVTGIYDGILFDINLNFCKLKGIKCYEIYLPFKNILNRSLTPFAL